jgi:hypothetical protein
MSGKKSVPWVVGRKVHHANDITIQFYTYMEVNSLTWNGISDKVMAR